MLENWMWDAEVLQSFAKDESGKPIPTELIEKMKQASDLGMALAITERLFRSALALELHKADPANLDLDALVENLQAQYLLTPPAPGSYPLYGFGHLDRYSAIFYAYLWSEVISDDLFTPFAESGLFNRAVAEHYREAILAPGGSRNAQSMVEDFLGRPYSLASFSDRFFFGIRP